MKNKNKIKNLEKKILLFFGDDHRNKFILNIILKKYKNCKVIIQKRGNEKIKKKSNYLIINHLKLRNKSEKKFLKLKKNTFLNHKDVTYIKLSDLNSKKVINIAKKYKPDLVVCYGITLLKKNLLSNLPKKIINIHSGLTQKFRGYASNFWACYMLEPNNVGATIHYVTEKPDRGNILHQVRTTLKSNYNLHDLSTICILKISKVINKIIDILLKKNPQGQKIIGGNLYLLKGFKQEHLLNNYKLFNDKLAKFYIDNNMKVKNIKLKKLI